MGNFLTNLESGALAATPLLEALAGVLPVALFVLRLVMIILGITVLSRCVYSLFRERIGKEVWGHLTLPNGVSYELNHWENVVGRAGSCDVILDFPSVSRRHCAILRDDKGDWTLFPLQSKNGTLHQGDEVAVSVPLASGDEVSLGGVELHFQPVSVQEQQDENRRLGVHKRRISPHKTLGLLTFFQGLMLLQSLYPLEAADIPKVLLSFLVLSGAMWGLYALYRAFQRTAFEVETLAFFLCTLSFGVAAFYSPASVVKQALAVILGLGLFFLLSVVLRDLKMAVSLRWPVAAFAGVLLTFNLLLGERIFGAKNWMTIGPFTFQPSEFIKIAFIIAGAATLDRLFANRNLIFTTLFAGFCVGCLALMSDFGTALVFFMAFLVIAFLRSGNLGFIVMLGAGAALALEIILYLKPYVSYRFEAWRHVWDFASTSGYQQTRTLSAIASGGLFGKDPSDLFLKNVGAANTDLIFGVVSEEFGLLLALCAVAAILALALFTWRSAGNARSSYYTIASCTAAAMLVTQTALNVLGSVDILPLTGITFPFLSIGGSSIISCWGLLAFIKAADPRRNASFTLRRPRFRRWDKKRQKAQNDPLPPQEEHFAGDWDPGANEKFWEELDREQDAFWDEEEDSE